ncbi:hypothetical protein J2Z69_001349 [Paenibacillus shirakamiensis]|uniref:Copper amine oxidase-like N-terminal domain-containing protein n=1 Tax=Paenibacillus shirakamiensis TaxID=1265935 RepID=A0ABS4JF37_9BACL|nr:copper amine oxidase N-terminal domain-containing protein [Paenibacillus shirakamiensis]MBP2000330.1 hypothetical protein [Paenibacillus shirakamiensis]
MKMKTLAIPVLGLTLVLPAALPAQVGAAAATRATVNTPAADLRANLDHLLSEHFALAVTAMTKAYDGSKDAEEAYKALDQNALDMQPAITSLYGEKGGAEFERIFRAHNKYTDDLVKATKMNNKEAREKALQQVQGFVDEFSTFLATATAGNLPKQAAKDAIRLHEDQVQKTFDEYVAGDYKDAYAAYREGYMTMFKISKALSGAIVTQMPEKFNNTKSDTKAADLRSALNSLASEHFALSALEMQKQFDGRNDYTYLIAAEGGNTADFKAAIASIYGKDGANEFERIWTTNHVNAQSDYVNAVKSGNTQQRDAVKQRIDGFTVEFANFLDTATAQNLPKSASLPALRTHEGQVQTTLDKYAANDFQGSYATNREGFKTMFGVGQALSNAIVNQFNDKFQEASTPMPTPTPTPMPTESSVWMKLNSKSLTINGKVTMMDTMPMVWMNKTYIPLRYLGEGIGANVQYDAKTQSVWVTAGSDTLKFWINKDFMEVNGMRKSVGAKVIVNKDGRTVVPVRFIAELLGWNVNFDAGQIHLTKSM